MTGTLVSIAKQSITLSHADTGDPDTTHQLVNNYKCFLNGIQCKPSDLKPGDEIELDADPASEVQATRA